MFSSIKCLWSLVDAIITDLGGVDSFLTSLTCNRSVFSVSDSLSSLFALVSTLSLQLQAIDDTEFIAQTKSLTLVDFGRLIHLLKALLYSGYWVRPVTRNYEEDRRAPQQKLYLAQLLLIATKLFNQLASRNERLNFLPEKQWLWSALSSSDLEVRPTSRYAAHRSLSSLILATMFRRWSKVIATNFHFEMSAYLLF
jgi:hypothetical protein